ncbi:MAG: hypothetical protein Fur006_25270 [Coleofasciculaceae cyanobacterium]
MIDNWEASDELQHFKTIRYRLLSCSQRWSQLLFLYRQILLAGEVQAFNQPEHMELHKSGLVVKEQGKLRVSNRIYASVFNQSWVDEVLTL